MRVFALLCFFLIASCASFDGRDPEKALLHMRLGLSQLEMGQNPQALVSLLKAEQLDPNNAQIQNGLGMAYWARQKLVTAEAHFKKAIYLDPKYTDAKNSLGGLLIERKAYGAAIPYLLEAEKDLTYPNPERPAGNLGIAYFHLKQYQVAQSYLEKSIELKRDNCSTLNFLGRTQFELGLYSQSLITLDRAIGFCQELQNDEPHYFSALANKELGKVSMAKARAEELIKLYPNGKYLTKAKLLLEQLKD